MVIIPAIDLQGGKCVRLSNGRKETATVYDVDPVKVARDFELAGAHMLHIIDLDAAFSGGGSSNRSLLQDIIRVIKIPVQFGGGLRRADDVRKVIELGVSRAIVGTLAVESTETLRGLVREFGDRLAASIDARDGQVMARGWQHRANIKALAMARALGTAGIERIIFTDIARDGMLGGPNIEQIGLIARASGVKITASGGVSSLEDIQRIKELVPFGVDSVIVGRAFYEGRFNLKEASQSIHRNVAAT